MQNLDRKIREYCAENQISGVMRITQRDEILYEAAIGYRDWEEKSVFCPKTDRFVFYSMSKPFCAFGFLKCVEKGQVRLSDHPGKVLREAAAFHPDVTFFDLLHHTSGLADFHLDKILPPELAAHSTAGLLEQIELLSHAPSVFAPGQGARYSNVNFLLLALCVEELSGMPYGEYMKKEVFSPLGMTGAVVDEKGLVLPSRVPGHVQVDGAPRKKERNYAWVKGGGDLVGGLDDAYALNRAVKHRLILSPDSWEKILTPTPQNGMGMGCSLKTWHGKEQVRHNGGHTGHRSLHIFLPQEDFDILFFSNTGYGDARRDLADLIHTHFFGEDGCRDDSAMDTGYAI